MMDDEENVREPRVVEEVFNDTHDLALDVGQRVLREPPTSGWNATVTGLRFTGGALGRDDHAGSSSLS